MITDRLMLVLVVAAGVGLSCRPSVPTTANLPLQATDGVDGGNATSRLPREATACQSVADCVRVPQRAESELHGGACCAVCAGYQALNRTFQARQPVCNGEQRGQCPVSCAEGNPPPVACESGQCVLTYPPVQTACQHDGDCVVVPRLLSQAQANGCRIACGQFVAGNRTWDAWGASLWENASVIGVCPSDCNGLPLPDAMCSSGQCVLRGASAVRVSRIDLRTPTVAGRISVASITALFEQNRALLTACTEQSRSRAPIGYAGFQMHFDIAADGRVGKVSSDDLATHLPDIARCMSRIVEGLQFPGLPRGGSGHVDFPMGVAVETM